MADFLLALFARLRAVCSEHVCQSKGRLHVTRRYHGNLVAQRQLWRGGVRPVGPPVTEILWEPQEGEDTAIDAVVVCLLSCVIVR